MNKEQIHPLLYKGFENIKNDFKNNILSKSFYKEFILIQNSITPFPLYTLYVIVQGEKELLNTGSVLIDYCEDLLYDELFSSYFQSCNSILLLIETIRVYGSNTYEPFRMPLRNVTELGRVG